MDDAEVARFWCKSPGVSRAVQVAVVVAAAVTVVLVDVLLVVLGRYFPVEPDNAHLDTVWVAGVALLVTTVTATLAVSELRGVSWWARAAVVLAAIQLAVVAIVAVAWYARPDTTDPAPPKLVEQVPAHWLALGLGAVVIAIAALPSRRRGVPRWLRGVVVLALAFLLVLGLWLPIAARWVHADAARDVDPDALARASLPFVLAPAALIALAVAALVVLTARTRRRLPVEVTYVGPVVLAGALTIAMTSLDGVHERAVHVYESCAHLIVAATLFALGALIALALAHLRALRTARNDARRPAPWVQAGTVDDPPGAVAHVVFQGWLAGFTTTAAAFTLRTDRALLHVPAGAHLVAPLGPWSTHASPGDAQPALHAGDATAVSGFIAPPADGPFRGSTAPIAGSHGLVVSAPRRDGETIRRDLVLVFWRPCLLFLLAAALAALPAVTVAADPDPPPRSHRPSADR